MLFFFLRNDSQASWIRVASLAQMSLIIEDPDNQLNLYDFGGNPAWLCLNEQRSWLRFSFVSFQTMGNFRRRYDPEKLTDLNFLFEGVKILENDQVFYGAVTLHQVQMKEVESAITRQPYANHPFRLTDNTSGTINYTGPNVNFRFSRNIFQQKLFIGGAATYQIETGLKDNFPQPRTIYRYAQFGIGLAYRFSPQFSLGTTFDHANTLEFTEIIEPGSFETRRIEIKKFRGEFLFTESKGSLERFAKNLTYEIGWQLSYAPLRLVTSAMLCRFRFQHLIVTENRFRPIKEGCWKEQGYEIFWRTRFKLPRLPFRLGLDFQHAYFDDWAQHPDFPVLLDADRATINRLGLGFSYEPIHLPILVAAQFFVSRSELRKNDYPADLIKSGPLENQSAHLGLEYFFYQKMSLRSGVIYAIQQISEQLLAFSEFQPKNKSTCLTAGLARNDKFFEIEVYGFWGEQLPSSTMYYEKKRDQWGAIFSLKYFQD